MDKKKVTILGSTGSIGVQTLEVLSLLKDQFEIAYLTANNNIDLLVEQIENYNPKGVIVRNKEMCRELQTKTSFGGKISCGKESLREAAGDSDNDIVVSALVGFSGVIPTLAAIESGTTVALANKETLVSAGHVITKAARENNVKLVAVDSEHSAVLQCLAGESPQEIEKLILTASGGPFLNTALEDFENLTVEQALNHPNWSMGSKITIDSATMMNKGFEIIEAYWLFDVKMEQIDVLIHPQSIVHSMVQFVDGSVKAQLGLPDMKIPISYALTYPRRLKHDFQRLKLEDLSDLSFMKPDFERYPCLKLAYDAIEIGGTAPVILNAANEIAVNAFLNRKIPFMDIPRTINHALQTFPVAQNPVLTDIIETDKEVRELIRKFLSKKD